MKPRWLRKGARVVLRYEVRVEQVMRNSAWVRNDEAGVNRCVHVRYLSKIVPRRAAKKGRT
jgi:hypothetical protein